MEQDETTGRAVDVKEGDTIRLYLNGEAHDITVATAKPDGKGGIYVTPDHPETDS